MNKPPSWHQNGIKTMAKEYRISDPTGKRVILREREGSLPRERQAKPRKYVRLSNGHVSALLDFSIAGTHWDSDVKGLRLRIGSTGRAVFDFFSQHRDHGKRKTICKKLGRWPEMTTDAARTAAKIEQGKVAGGTYQGGKRDAVKLGAAFAEYITYLERRAAERGKPAASARVARQLGHRHVLPEFETWPLADLAAQPEAVRDWHESISKRTPIDANRAASLLRAVYKHACRTDRSLNRAHIPTSGIYFNAEQRSQKGMEGRDFPRWREAWQALPDPIHRAYHLVNLLTGARPGELARLKWSDIDTRKRTLTIKGAKASYDIVLPLSLPIVQALKLARDHRNGSDLVFPYCGDAGHRDPLPARGLDLRRVYKTMHVGQKIDDLTSHLLMGHTPPGVSGGYVLKLVALHSTEMRREQAKISRRILELLGSPAVR